MSTHLSLCILPCSRCGEPTIHLECRDFLWHCLPCRTQGKLMARMAYPPETDRSYRLFLGHTADDQPEPRLSWPAALEQWDIVDEREVTP